MRVIGICVAVLCVLALSAYAVEWFRISRLDLMGAKWDKPVIAVFLKPEEKVSKEAVADVERAISDWNNALRETAGAPKLSVTNKEEAADIVVTMKATKHEISGYVESTPRPLCAYVSLW